MDNQTKKRQITADDEASKEAANQNPKYKPPFFLSYGLFDRDRYRSCGLYNNPTESIIAFIALANFQCPSLDGPLK